MVNSFHRHYRGKIPHRISMDMMIDYNFVLLLVVRFSHFLRNTWYYHMVCIHLSWCHQGYIHQEHNLCILKQKIHRLGRLLPNGNREFDCKEWTLGLHMH